MSTIIGVAGQAGVQLGSLPAMLNRSYGVAYIAGGKLAIAASTEQSVLLADVP